jgi:hypothetical protein
VPEDVQRPGRQPRRLAVGQERLGEPARVDRAAEFVGEDEIAVDVCLARLHDGDREQLDLQAERRITRRPFGRRYMALNFRRDERDARSIRDAALLANARWPIAVRANVACVGRCRRAATPRGLARARSPMRGRRSSDGRTTFH